MMTYLSSAQTTSTNQFTKERETLAAAFEQSALADVDDRRLFIWKSLIGYQNFYILSNETA